MERMTSFSAHFEAQGTFNNLIRGLNLLVKNDYESAKKHLNLVSDYLIALCDGAHIEEMDLYEDEWIINISIMLGGPVDPENLSIAIGKESHLYYAEYFDDSEGPDRVYSFRNGKKIPPSEVIN